MLPFVSCIHSFIKGIILLHYFWQWDHIQIVGCWLWPGFPVLWHWAWNLESQLRVTQTMMCTFQIINKTGTFQKIIWPLFIVMVSFSLKYAKLDWYFYFSISSTKQKNTYASLVIHQGFTVLAEQTRVTFQSSIIM